MALQSSIRLEPWDREKVLDLIYIEKNRVLLKEVTRLRYLEITIPALHPYY